LDWVLEKDTTPSPPNMQNVFQLFVEVSITHMLATTELMRIMPHKLTLSQFSLLSHFSRTDNLQRSIVDLAGIFQVSKPSMGETIEKLLQKGFVNVDPNPDDRRGKIVSMTPAGAQAKMDAEQAIFPLLELMIKDLGADQVDTAYHALRPIRVWLDNNRNH
jgi:DNA-binding MarR family transcriptional regulator